jgi:anti-sigma factor RsiW
MRVLTLERFGRWTRGTGIVALVVLAWAVFIPDGLFWTALLAAGLTGAVVATALLVRSRRVPSLAQVIASAEASPVAVPAGNGYTSIAGLRPSPRGVLKP